MNAILNMEKKLRELGEYGASDPMAECLKVQSGGCHSKDQVCPNYLSKDRSPKCNDLLKYLYPKMFVDQSYSSAAARTTYDALNPRREDARNLFDRKKQELCNEPENMNYEFCSCLARKNPDSRWNKGDAGFKAFFNAQGITDTKDPEQCWYNPCYLASSPDYLTGKPQIMTVGSLTQDPELGGERCVNNAVCRFNMNSFGNSKIEASKMLVNCNVNQDDDTTPDPPRKLNINLIVPVVLALLVLLVLLLR